MKILFQLNIKLKKKQNLFNFNYLTLQNHKKKKS